MNKFRTLFFCLFVCSFVVSCATNAQKFQEEIRKGVYASKRSVEVGRIELALKYLNELSRLVPPPKVAIDIKPLSTKNKNGTDHRYIVLPKDLEGQDVLVIGSAELNKIMEENKAVKDQLAADSKHFDDYNKAVSVTYTKAIDELNAEKKKSHLFGWISGLSITGLILVVAGCIVFPAFIPIAINISTGIFTGLVSGVNAVVAMIAGLIKKKE